MDCREAQALIVPFIEGKLSDEQNEKFIAHIEECSDCYDELEVYYIVIIGVKQLDEEHHMIMDFNGDLKKYIAYKKEQITKKHNRSTRIKIGVFSALTLFVVAAGLLTYGIYNHPDLVARYRVAVTDFLHIEVDRPAGKVQHLWQGDISPAISRLEMPLRRIQTKNNTETPSLSELENKNADSEDTNSDN